MAHTWGRTHLRVGDAIVLTEMEHHANIVPWHMLAAERGIEHPLDPGRRRRLPGPRRPRPAARRGQAGRASPACRTCSGTINPVAEIAEAAHAAGAVVVADGAQSVPHLPTDVTALGVDFLAFSAHKMLGPTGIGVLWGREELLEPLPPVPRWRRDDPRRPQGRVHPERHPLAVRGRHAADHRGHRTRCGGRLPRGRRDGRASAPTRSR